VNLVLNHSNTIDPTGFDDVVVASGVAPKPAGIPGEDLPHVVSYDDLLSGRAIAGKSVVVIGAGGIGFDVATYLVEEEPESLVQWKFEWGIADPAMTAGGLGEATPKPPKRQVTLLQRKAGTPGRGLGKTTGWIHRASLHAHHVRMLGGVTYDKITRDGVHIHRDGASEIIPGDTVVICAGQVSVVPETAPKTHVIGGAKLAGELDAKRAIDEGTRLGAAL